MKYIAIETCHGCPMTFEDESMTFCKPLSTPLKWRELRPIGVHPDCPLSDLPEWGLLAEGEVIQEGDEVNAYRQWVPVPEMHHDTPWNASYNPVRRRMGGGK